MSAEGDARPVTATPNLRPLSLVPEQSQRTSASLSDTPLPTRHQDTLLTRAALHAGSAHPGHTGHGSITGHALVLRCEVATDRAGNPYLALTQRGSDGTRFEARWWRYPYPAERRPRVGQICWWQGTVDTFGGDLQLRVRQARPSPEIDPAVFARATRRTLVELQAELDDRIAGLEPEWASLVGAVLQGDVAERFRTWPAAHQHHGAVRHGLLAHSLRVMDIACRLAVAYGPDGLVHDQQVVQVACLLHDIGKVFTIPPVVGAVSSDTTRMFDHVSLGAMLVRDAAHHIEPRLASARLDALLHAILAHHGRKEWGAPVEPQTVEAWLVHLADLAEARLWAWSQEESADAG